MIDSATDTERVHTVLHDLLPPKVYYRFNPYLSEISGLDETDPIRWQRMLDDVEMYIRKNERKMEEAARYIGRSQLSLISHHVKSMFFYLPCTQHTKRPAQCLPDRAKLDHGEATFDAKHNCLLSSERRNVINCLQRGSASSLFVSIALYNSTAFYLF